MGRKSEKEGEWGERVEKKVGRSSLAARLLRVCPARLTEEGGICLTLL